LAGHQQLTAEYQVTGIGLTFHGRNGGGDPYNTDGELTVGVLTEGGVENPAGVQMKENPMAVQLKDKGWRFWRSFW
jgi:hypothetical protein